MRNVLVPTSFTLMLAAAVAFAQSNAAGEDWPQFRGPGGRGISNERGLPLTWGPDANILWKVQLPGAGTSSPIVIGDRILLTAHSGYQVPWQRGGDISKLMRHVVCLALADGKILWQNDFPAAQPETKYVGEGHGYASNTPIADDRQVYVFLGKSGVVAMDFSGKALWRANVGDGIHQWGSAASPVLYKELLIVNAAVESESLVAINRQSGKEAWRYRGVKQAWNTPILVDVPGAKTELVLGMEGKLAGLDPDTGQELWTCRGNAVYICATPASDHGIVWAPWTMRTLAVRAGGRGEVSGTHQLWNFWRHRAGGTVPSPVYHEGKLYFANDRNGSVYCMDAQSGEVVYEQKLPGSPGKLYASPILADGRIYYVARTGGAFVVAAKPQYELLAQNDLGDTTHFDATPAVAPGRLLLRSNRYLYCIGQK